MQVLLMRHGKTAGNSARRYVGITDEPLCSDGIADAQRSGIDLKTTAVYVSPMKRALETAKIKFPYAQQTVCADLREMDFGDFEGRTADEMKCDPAYVAWVESNCLLPCPNGEGIVDFSERICRAFETIVRECIDNGDEKLVIVAHGGSIMAILSRYTKTDRKYYEWYVNNCCGYRAQLDAIAWHSAPLLTECEMFDTLG